MDKETITRTLTRSDFKTPNQGAQKRKGSPLEEQRARAIRKKSFRGELDGELLWKPPFEDDLFFDCEEEASTDKRPRSMGDKGNSKSGNPLTGLSLPERDAEFYRVFQELKDEKTATKEKLNELAGKMSGLEKALDESMANVNQRISTNERAMNEKFEELRNEFRHDIKKCLDGVKEGNKALLTSLAEEDKIELAKRTAVLSSIPYVPGETIEELKEKVSRYLVEVAGLSTSDIESLCYASCRRQAMIDDKQNDKVELVLSDHFKRSFLMAKAARNMRDDKNNKIYLSIPSCLAAKYKRLQDIAAKIRGMEARFQTTVRYVSTDDIITIKIRAGMTDRWSNLEDFMKVHPEFDWPVFHVTKGPQ